MASLMANKASGTLTPDSPSNADSRPAILRPGPLQNESKPRHGGPRARLTAKPDKPNEHPRGNDVAADISALGTEVTHWLHSVVDSRVSASVLTTSKYSSGSELSL